MKVYMYCAALLCPWCGKKRREQVAKDCGICGGKHPDLGLDCRSYQVNEQGIGVPVDESMYDSDDFPKGPYPYGGGEADCPQHCDACGIFLENPLTEEGAAYVREAALVFGTPNNDRTWEDIARLAEVAGSTPRGNGPTVAEWIRFYLAPGQ